MYLAPRSIWLAVFLAVAMALWPFGPFTACLVAVIVIALAAGLDARRAPAAAGLQLSMAAPEVAGVGQTVPLSVRFHNPTGRRLSAGIHLHAPPSLGREPVRARYVLGPGEWSEAEFGLSPSVRGYAEVGPVTVRTLGPWGLAGRQVTLPVTAVVKVYPALPGRRQMALRLNRPLFLRSGIRASARRGEGTEFDSVRPYHPDDEFRRINWRATARASEPISNTFRQERNQRLLILVDAGRTMSTSINGQTRFEHAMDSCVALAELAGHLGDHVGMMAFSSRPLAVVPPRSGTVHARLILDQLFQIHPGLDASDYRRAFGLLLARFSRRALLVLITELSEPAAMQSLFQAMPVLVRRHLVIVASMTDPGVDELRSQTPANSSEAYLKAASEALLLGRESSARRLRSMGAVVVDQAPGELPGRLADEYLRLKAFGRL